MICWKNLTNSTLLLSTGIYLEPYPIAFLQYYKYLIRVVKWSWLTILLQLQYLFENKRQTISNFFVTLAKLKAIWTLPTTMIFHFPIILIAFLCFPMIFLQIFGHKIRKKNYEVILSPQQWIQIIRL